MHCYVLPSSAASQRFRTVVEGRWAGDEVTASWALRAHDVMRPGPYMQLMNK